MSLWERLCSRSVRLWASQTRDRSRIHSICVLVATLAVSSFFVVATHTRLSQTADEPNHLATGLEWWQMGTYRLHPENPPLARIAIAASPFHSGWRLRGGGNAWEQGTRLLYDGRRPLSYRERLQRMRMGVLPFHLLTVILVWLLAVRVGGYRAGIFSSVLVATTGPLLGHAGLATTDVPFVGTFLLALYGLIVWLDRPTIPHALLFGVGLTLALSTKLSMLVFLPATVAVIVPVWLWTRPHRGQRQPERKGMTGTGGATDPRPTPHPPGNADTPLPPGNADTPLPLPWPRWWRGWRARLGGLGILMIVAFLGVWGAYRFSIGRADQLPGVSGKIDQCAGHGMSWKRSVLERLARTHLPAPEFLQGTLWVCAHNRVGHLTYLLGKTSQRGFGAFYLVAIGVRTPLPLLALALLGAGWVLLILVRQRRFPETRRRLWPLAAVALTATSVLVTASAGSINLGLRHVLVVLPLFAVLAGWAVARLWDLVPARALRRSLLAILVSLQVLGFIRAHPHHLAYFNALAGEEPGRILVDSDLDWGQDYLELEDLLRSSPIRRFHLAYFGTAEICRHGLPRADWLLPGRRVTGWIAISEMYFRGLRSRMLRDPCNPRSAFTVPVQGDRSYSWLDRYRPVMRAGRSIRIYYVPE